MNKSIEDIWKDGFINERMEIPKINRFYNQKSISTVEQIIKRFEREVFLLLPLAVGLFLFNLWLDNDNAAFWGIMSAIPSLVWFYFGKKQIKSLLEINYKADCYQYLVAIQEKLNVIRRFNKRLIISSIPIVLFPMLVYTYFNQQGKTLGEILGVEGLDLPTVFIFIFLPIFTLVAYLITEMLFNQKSIKEPLGIDAIIKEMEELRK